VLGFDTPGMGVGLLGSGNARNVSSCHPKGAEVPGSSAARFPASSGGHHPLKLV